MKAFVDSARANLTGYIERRNGNGTVNPADQGRMNRPRRQGQQLQSQPNQSSSNTPLAGESQQGPP